MNYHIRQSATPLELKDHRRLSFYAVLWNEETTVQDYASPYNAVMKYREVVRPGAFSERISNRGRVVATVDHDEAQTFAEFPGALLLQEDSTGLFASCELPKSDTGDSVRSAILSGKLTGCSFRFPAVGNSERWTEGQVPLRELLQVKLLDVTLTDAPAYKSTLGEVHLRSARDWRENALKLMKLKAHMLHKA